MALPKLIVILGPTACGKSGLGVALAQKFQGEIVSADSRQVYRGLDLGTGKVTQAEMQGVAHHMLDVVEPGQPYSVADFQKGAYAAIDGILARGRVPFLVGGTGLYIRAVCQGFVFQDTPPNPAFRQALEGKGAPELYALLQAKTGVTLNESERANRQRLIRLLEKAEGGTLAEVESVTRYQTLLLGLAYPKEQLYKRIEQRLTRRLDEGMVEEVVGLRDAGVSDDFLVGLGLEYRYILWHLTGQLPTTLEQDLGHAIKRFSKRQTSWFKQDRDVVWLDAQGDPVGQAAQAIEQFLAGTDPIS